MLFILPWILNLEPTTPEPTGTGFRVYRSGDDGPIDYSNHVAETTELTWTSPTLDAPGV